MADHRFQSKKFLVHENSKVQLSKISTDSGDELRDKSHGAEALEADIESLRTAQERLYASNHRALLVILQGMDTSGKDGIIRHVLRGVSPLGCRVNSFRAPNTEELEHHFLWRPMRFLPPKGTIALFNRSYYEEVLVVRVHPKFLEPQNLLPYKSLNDLWERRFREIRSFEKTLVDSGTSVLKFYLHISRKEQRKRLLERLEDPRKYWKFNAGDLAERKLWPQYVEAFEEALSKTSTAEAPWYIIPADDKWYARAAVADIIASHLESLDLEFPEVTRETLSQFEQYAQALRDEND
ncbi:MAG: polyphosphate kinase 2 family protein [Pirellula sp.]|jgi:PPK2 family polyphosphate:nucleotide phosphotransferase|nr:polyphosphate kinase 2 family protein [Pirellula sp.]